MSIAEEDFVPGYIEDPYLSARITVSPPKSNQRLWKSESRYGYAHVNKVELPPQFHSELAQHNISKLE
jgi:hypothetical protein